MLKKWISMQKLAQIYMHSWRQRCKIDNFVFDISIHPNMRMLEKGKYLEDSCPSKVLTPCWLQLLWWRILQKRLQPLPHNYFKQKNLWNNCECFSKTAAGAIWPASQIWKAHFLAPISLFSPVSDLGECIDCKFSLNNSCPPVHHPTELKVHTSWHGMNTIPLFYYHLLTKSIRGK